MTTTSFARGKLSSHLEKSSTKTLACVPHVKNLSTRPKKGRGKRCKTSSKINYQPVIKGFKGINDNIEACYTNHIRPAITLLKSIVFQPSCPACRSCPMRRKLPVGRCQQELLYNDQGLCRSKLNLSSPICLRFLAWTESKRPFCWWVC